MNWYTLVGMFFFVFWCSLVGMPWTVRRLACHRLADLERHVLIGRAWLLYHWLADTGWYSMDWQTFVVCMRLYLPAICCQLTLLNYALQAACPLFAIFPTICTIPNYSQLLFPTILNYLHCHKYFQQANLSWHAMHGQTLVGIPVSSRPWLWDQWFA